MPRLFDKIIDTGAQHVIELRLLRKELAAERAAVEDSWFRSELRPVTDEWGGFTGRYE